MPCSRRVTLCRRSRLTLTLTLYLTLALTLTQTSILTLALTRTSTRTSILASTEPSHQPSPSNPSPTCTEQVAALFSEHCSTRVDAIKGDVEVVDLEEFKVTV